jgi:hypothetical protein
MELLKPFYRGSRGVLPADEITVNLEIFACREDVQDILHSKMPSGRTVEEGEKISLGKFGLERGRIHIKSTSPDGEVEIIPETEINVESESDRSSVMGEELSRSDRLKLGVAEPIFEVLGEEEPMQKEEIVNEVDERISPPYDIYHITDTERIEEHIDAGLRWLVRKGEVVNSGTGYEIAEV